MSATNSRTAADVWFRRVLWMGILANLALAIPTLLAPDRMMALSGLPPASPVLWPRFAGLLLILLSLFYMPAGVDPNRYRAVAWLAVMARLAGAIFFLVFQSAAYHRLGYFDLVFFCPELILLARLPASAASPAPGSLGTSRPDVAR